MDRRFDTAMFLTVMLLISLGIIMVYSSSSIIAMRKYGDSYYFLKKQLLFASAGVLVMFIVSRLDYRLYRGLAYPILGTAFVLLILVLIPNIGAVIGGSRRWLRFAGFYFQPSEFMKIAIVIYMAHSLAKKGERVKEIAVGIVPHMLFLCFALLLLMLQPDFGASSIIVAVSFMLLYTAGAKIRHLAAIVLMALPAVYIALFHTPYRRRRIMAFLNPWEDQQDVGFQIIQSFLAFGSGGMFGAGLGDGRQKMFYLPEPFTDFIFSNIAEELGFIGVVSVLACFFIFIMRGLKVARTMEEPFGRYLALGLTLVIGMQALINMAVVMGLLPTKGLALPFISYGGSSLIMSLIGVGILLNISSQAREQG